MITKASGRKLTPAVRLPSFACRHRSVRRDPVQTTVIRRSDLAPQPQPRTLLNAESMASLMFICLTALVSVTALFVVCWRRYYRLHAFKGPLFASISELWLVKVSLESRMHIAQQECLERYGSPTRIGPNLLVTNDPELLRHMSAPKSTWTRGSWYEEFDFGGAPTVFSERDEKGHARLRGKLGPAVCSSTSYRNAG